MNTTLNFLTTKLTVDDIAEINNPDTLHVIDFRATGETLQHEIVSMFTYENLSQWLPSMDGGRDRGWYAVNTTKLLRDDLEQANVVVAVADKKASKAVIDRITVKPKDATRIWAGIPHPSLDNYCRANNLSINYSYDAFLRYNNKLTQKHHLKDLSPEYFEITDKEDLQRAKNKGSGFIKASIGAGGFSVLDVRKDTEKIEKMTPEILSGNIKWYYEATASGLPYSVQLYKKGDSYTLFGYAKQYIHGTNYTGAKILDVTRDVDERLRSFIYNSCCQVHPMLDQYTGFLGIDLMIDDITITALELNVRLTATTIPTLLANATGTHNYAEYFEEVSANSVDANDISIAISHDEDEVCTIRFNDAPREEVGRNAYIQLTDCRSLPPKLDENQINEIRLAVERNVSATVSTQVKNFWPHGWTLSFILAESHCVLSSWHLQKNIFIDVFCCADMDVDGLVTDLSNIFEGIGSVLEISKRYTQ